MQLDLIIPSLSPSLSIKDVILNSCAHASNCPISVSDYTHVDSIITSIPKIDLNCEGVPGEEEGVRRGPLPGSNYYYLCSHDKKSTPLETVWGLGMDLSLSNKRKSRGRKTNLPKAQIRAKIDIADGKQMSISEVLRVANPCVEVEK